ncbi:MAG: glycosyltransferase [Gammaproteobacteria bacterium]|jgi:UDP:flavonoid glycosyltransferase YjiC (YdhE family)
MIRRKRILFFAEAVTLAHVTRPLILARSLDPERYEVHFACASGYDFLFEDAGFTRWSIETIPAERFLNALATGSRLYNYQTLVRYLEDDLRVLDAVSPDLVVGDFRLSLAVSAPLRKVPYAALANAHWSPCTTSGFPLPEHPMASILGVGLANALFQMVRPVIFAYHGMPLNRLRRRHGFPALGDLRHVYTHGDYTLYTDIPEMIPISSDCPSTHRYIGPVIWSPDMPLPDWWDSLSKDKPCVYVTLGTSGRSDLLPDVIHALGALPLTAIVATAGRKQLEQVPDNVYVADYLPGLAAAQRADLVICSGGSATAYQALSQGVPVLGIAANMDQYLTMNGICHIGAGRLLRAGRTDSAAVTRLVTDLLGNEDYRAAARRIAAQFSEYDAASRFGVFVQEYLATQQE